MRLKNTSYHRGGWPLFALAAATLWGISCAPLKPATNSYSARPWAEAEGLFHRDPRWLGADAALSVPLGNGRTLWLFGDTFVARSRANVRSESEMVRNTVAIQVGDDPRIASIAFSWRTNVDGSPASFFPEHGQSWYWPGHGIRLAEGPLVIFLYVMVGTPGKGLGFACTGYALAVIDDPDMPAATWEWSTEIADTVFISYSHDSADHIHRVLALSNRLRSDGVDCELDQYEESPPEDGHVGWSARSARPPSC